MTFEQILQIVPLVIQAYHELKTDGSLDALAAAVTPILNAHPSPAVNTLVDKAKEIAAQK